MTALIFPLLVVLLAYNFYTIKILNNQIAVNSRDTLSIYEKPVINDINYISYSMANALANKASMLQLNYASDYMEAYICCNEIVDDFKAMIQSDLEGLGALGVCSSDFNVLRTVYSVNGNYSYKEKSELDRKMKQFMLEEDYYKSGWQLLSLENRSFLIRVLRHGSVSVAVVIDFSLLSTPQAEKGANNGYLIYTSEDNKLLTMQDYVNEHAINLTPSTKSYYISGSKQLRYMVVQKQFLFAGVRQYYVVPYQGVFRYLDFIQILLMVLTVVIACFIPVGYYSMKKKLFNPLETMVDTMVSIGSGQLEAKMEEEYNIDEFKKVKNAFNIMIDRIRELKINAYEQEIHYKNVQMQYLQIQIRPHFFLNCLKNIYAMAKQQEYEAIQEMILLLSQ
jgi:two-component system sensor histidine kinase YesM